MVYIEVTDDNGDGSGTYGTYTDEATGNTEDLPELRAATITSDSAAIIHVTPFTEMAVDWAENRSGKTIASDMAEANTLVATQFGLGASFDIIGTSPSSDTLYKLALAGISQTIKNGSLLDLSAFFTTYNTDLQDDTLATGSASNQENFLKGVSNYYVSENLTTNDATKIATNASDSIYWVNSTVTPTGTPANVDTPIIITIQGIDADGNNLTSDKADFKLIFKDNSGTLITSGLTVTDNADTTINPDSNNEYAPVYTINGQYVAKITSSNAETITVSCKSGNTEISILPQLDITFEAVLSLVKSTISFTDNNTTAVNKTAGTTITIQFYDTKDNPIDIKPTDTLEIVYSKTDGTTITLNPVSPYQHDTVGSGTYTTVMTSDTAQASDVYFKLNGNRHKDSGGASITTEITFVD